MGLPSAQELDRHLVGVTGERGIDDGDLLFDRRASRGEREDLAHASVVIVGVIVGESRAELAMSGQLSAPALEW